jgi:hypothetical protein
LTAGCDHIFEVPLMSFISLPAPLRRAFAILWKLFRTPLAAPPPDPLPDAPPLPRLSTRIACRRDA